MKRMVSWLLALGLMMGAVYQEQPLVAYAAWDPVGCTDVVVALSLNRSLATAHFGDTVTFRARIDNSAASNCSLGNMTITITTPDGTANVVASGLDVPQGTVTPWFSVDYVISSAHIVNNRASASASASGVVHDNPGADNPASSSSSTTVLVSPVVNVLTVCTQGANATDPQQIQVSGTTTDVPAGGNVAVSIGTASGNTTTAADGSWSLLLPWGQASGTYNIPVTVTYGTGNSGTTTKTVDVKTVQISGGGSASTHQLQPAIAGTTDAAAGSTITVTIGAQTANATVQADGSWSVSWPSALAYGNSYTVSARVDVGAGSCGSDSQTLTVANAAPVAVDDAYNVNEDETLTVPAAGLLGNDTDADGDALTAAKVSDPANGTVTLNADGSFTYTPAAGYSGPDSFTYRANDGTADSNVATVNLSVGAVNDPPVAVDDAYSVNEDQTLTVPAAGILGNDTDADGDALTAAKVTDPAHGTLTLNADGSFTYVPAANYNGPDSFTYRANDGTANSNVATVAITVSSVNDPPVAADNTYTVSQDLTLAVAVAGILGNDTDADGDALTAAKVTDPANGTVTLNADGSFNYVPAPGFSGTDTFTYRASDGTADSNVATVTITVSANAPPPPPMNFPPVANGDAYTVDEDTTLTVPARGIVSNDTDYDGDWLTTVKFSDPAHGTLVLKADGEFTYKPQAMFSGTDTFSYRVSDGKALSNLAWVTITVRDANHPPVAAGDTYSVSAGSVLNVPARGVLANDSDADGDPLSVIPGSGTANGTLALSRDGGFQYTPAPGFTGTDTFTYVANDGTSPSNKVTVTIDVRPATPPQEVHPVIQGVVIDAATGQVIVGATVAVRADFDGDGKTDFEGAMVTGPDGRYKIDVPRGGWTYTCDVTMPVKTAAGTVNVTTSHQTVVDTSGTNSVFNAEKKIAGQVFVAPLPGRQPRRPDEALVSGEKVTVTLLTAGGVVNKPVTVSKDGLFEVAGVAPGDYRVAFQVVAPDGTVLAGASIPAAVTGDGELVVGTALIDPTGVVTDAVTKKPLADVKVSLYWADTALNRQQGRTPGAPVTLPGLPDFQPNANAMPQLTTDQGVYAWLVYPQGDYYIQAERAGYLAYDSRNEGRNTPAVSGEDSLVQAGVIHVGTSLVRYDFAMYPIHRRFILGYPDGTFKPERSITRAEIAAIFARIIQPTPVELPLPPYSDVPATHWAKTYIELVRQKGLMMGDPNGQFRPDAPITRAELATIISRYKGLTPNAPNPFFDTAGHWAEAAISANFQAGLVTGYPDGSFHPEAATIRAEAATMINRVLGRGPLTGRSEPTWPDVPFAHWASGQVEEASTSHGADRNNADEEHWISDTGEATW